MAKAKTTNRVAIEQPRGSEDKFISVNGVSYIIPKKGRHEVPPEIAEEYARSQRAEDILDSTKDYYLNKNEK